MWVARHADWKLVHGQAGSESPELFNLAQDVGERNNLASAQPERVKELQALWDSWNARQAAPQPPQDRPAKRQKRKTKKD